MRQLVDFSGILRAWDPKRNVTVCVRLNLGGE
jgi:hypothetical protein